MGSHLVYCFCLRIRPVVCQTLTDTSPIFYLKCMIMEALYLSHISSSIGSLSLSIERFPGNILISSFLKFKPVLHYVLSLVSTYSNTFPFVFYTTPSQYSTILPFMLCFSGLKASSFSSSLQVHILFLVLCLPPSVRVHPSCVIVPKARHGAYIA